MTSLPPDAALKILVIDENPIRRAILQAGLREAGFGNVVLVKNTTGLLDQVYRIDPDVILIDLENPSRDVIEQMFQVSRIVRRPIAMFVDQSDRNTIEAASLWSTNMATGRFTARLTWNICSSTSRLGFSRSIRMTSGSME